MFFRGAVATAGESTLRFSNLSVFSDIFEVSWSVTTAGNHPVPQDLIVKNRRSIHQESYAMDLVAQQVIAQFGRVMKSEAMLGRTGPLAGYNVRRLTLMGTSASRYGSQAGRSGFDPCP